jgi:GNAT superfamily N-acetyltransferase
MVSQKFQLPMPIVCRPALPLDTPGMLELTRHIWEGEDYVPHTWDDWMADPEGVLAVAEFKARVVGLGKLSKLSEFDWWLEGLRVHPEYEGKGIASRLNDYLLKHWQQRGSGAVRLATISKREPVMYMVKKRGFKLIGEYTTYQTQLSQSRNPTSQSAKFHLVESTEIGDVLTWLITPDNVHLDFGVMDLGWQFAPPRYEFIEKYVQDGKIWWWQDQKGLLVMVTKMGENETWARIRMLACKREDYLACLLDAHTFAQQQGYGGVTWKAPNIPGIDIELSQADFIQEKNYTLQIYEKNYSQEKNI